MVHTCACGKVYSSRAGLWKHRQKCSVTAPIDASGTSTPDDGDLKALVHKILEHDTRTRDQMMGQLARQNEIIKEMIPRLGNNNNNRFNINLFLKEDCRDAINMSDFIESLQVKLADLQYTQDNGLIEGISSVLVDGLRQLDTCRRPIHCSDVKREVLYIKDNDEWNRQNTTQHLRTAIVDVANKQRKAIAEWERQNPTWKSTAHGREDYIRLVQSVMADIDAPQTENQIIRTIAKETVIKKQIHRDD